MEETIILRRGTRPERVYFIFKGNVENTTTGRIMSAGSFFGEKDILKNHTVRIEGFTAATNAYLLSFSKEDFLEILNTFSDINEHVMMILFKRQVHEKYVISG